MMDSFITVLVCSLIGFLVLLNVGASYIVCKTYFEVKARKKYQLFFIWLIPFIGAALAIYIHRESWFEERRIDKIGNHSNISNSEAISHASALNSGK